MAACCAWISARLGTAACICAMICACMSPMSGIPGIEPIIARICSKAASCAARAISSGLWGFIFSFAMFGMFQVV